MCKRDSLLLSYARHSRAPCAGSPTSSQRVILPLRRKLPGRHCPSRERNLASARTERRLLHTSIDGGSDAMLTSIASRTGACVPGTAVTGSDLAGTAAGGNLRRRRMKPDQFIIASLMLPACLPRRRGRPHGYRQRGAPGVTYRNHGRVSEFGSEMGAAGLRQAPSGPVCGTDRRWLTWENVPEQRVGQPPDSVRIEGVRGSNPLSSTQTSRSEP
jgi:hypothetical protein